MIKTIDKVTIMNSAREHYRLEHEAELKKQAQILFDKYKNDPLFIAGIMLYWAEGKTTQKETCQLELNNSDPNLLKLYCLFLRKYLNITESMFRVRLFLYPDLNEVIVKLFWAKALNVPLNQFIKSYIRNSHSSVTKNKLTYGTCSLYITKKDLRLTMATWIEQFVSFVFWKFKD